MSTPQELEAAFWKALKSDRTVMLGLADGTDRHLRPMTAIYEESGPTIWFFTSHDNGIVEALADGASHQALASFVSKGHDLYAAFDGQITVATDRATIDRLWNPFVAAWYDGGKDDPKLVLLRLEPGDATIWQNANSVFTGLKMLLGVDVKADAQSQTAQVSLR